MRKLIQIIVLALPLVSLSSVSIAQTTLLSLQKQWAIVNYTLKDDPQEEAFEKLIEEAKKFTAEDKKDAERLIWSGIIKSSYAGAKGGLGALSYAKAAKKDLEQAITVDETALSGSAHTSLATLYSKVPGWPIGFGSNKKAAQHFKKALQLNPDGIDPNYFYGEFLYEEKSKYQDAENYLKKAQQAKPRKERPLADQERQKEITALLAKVTKKLKRKKRRR